MKNVFILILLFFTLGTSAQKLNSINSDLKLSDSLTNESEIRIYRGGGISNYSSLFRMYKNKSDKWKAEFYEHYAIINGQDELRTEKRTLKSKKVTDFIWNRILRTNIQMLPNIPEIKYKMRKRGDVKLVDGEYQLHWASQQIMDGVGYTVQIKDGDKFNEVDYGNPESYLKIYPEVDELIYFNELIDLIKSEFNLWKE